LRCPDVKSGLPIGRGDFSVDGNNVRFLLSGVDAETDKTKVQWWNSQDSGLSFMPGELLLEFGDFEGEPSAAMAGRPKSLSNLDSPGSAASAFIRNAHPDARMIVAEKPKKSEWRRMYLLGDKGPVNRSRNKP